MSLLEWVIGPTGDSPMLKLAKDYKKKIIAQNDWGEKKN
jgi:hypothetical protein